MEVTLVVVGDNQVGKTALTRRGQFGTFVGDRGSTIIPERFKTKVTLPFSGEEVTVALWDTCGIAGPDNLPIDVVKKAHGCLMICDAMRPETLENLTIWREAVLDQRGEGIDSTFPFMAFVNKDDVDDKKKEITAEMISAWSEDNGFPAVVRGSVKEETRVKDVIAALAGKAVANSTGVTAEQSRLSPIKVAVVGTDKSGSTSLVQRLFLGSEDTDWAKVGTAETYGSDVHHAVIETENRVIRFQVWDVSTDEAAHATRMDALNGAEVVLYVGNATNPGTFVSLKAVMEAVGDDRALIVVANKGDQGDSVSSVLKGQLRGKSAPLIVASALSGKGIKELFNEIERMRPPTPREVIEFIVMGLAKRAPSYRYLIAPDAPGDQEFTVYWAKVSRSEPVPESAVRTTFRFGAPLESGPLSERVTFSLEQQAMRYTVERCPDLEKCFDMLRREQDLAWASGEN